MYYDDKLTTPGHAVCRRALLDKIRQDDYFDEDLPGERLVPDLETLIKNQSFPGFEGLRRRVLGAQAHWQVFTLDEIDRRFFDVEFLTLAHNRMLMGAFRYGDMVIQVRRRLPYDIIGSAFRRLELYQQEPNMEPLLDIFNICQIEWLVNYTFGGESYTDLGVNNEPIYGIGSTLMAQAGPIYFALDWYKATKNKAYLAWAANACAAEWVLNTEWGEKSRFHPVDDGLHCHYTDGKEWHE